MKVTLDTNLWIDLAQLRNGHEHVLTLLEWHKVGKIQIRVSDRFLSTDTVKMTDQERKERILGIFEQYKINTVPSTFRFGISTLSGADLLSGGFTNRTTGEMAIFRDIALVDPSQRKKEKSQHVGDFDALYDHFCSYGDVFLTRDNKNIFTDDKRDRFLAELGLQVESPRNFIDLMLNP